MTFSLLAGGPPPGISLLSNGAFSGTSSTSGVFSFAARATGARPLLDNRWEIATDVHRAERGIATRLGLNDPQD